MKRNRSISKINYGILNNYIMENNNAVIIKHVKCGLYGNDY